MRIVLEGATLYGGAVLGEGESPDVSLEAVSDGESEPLSVRVWVGETSVCILDVDELERALAYCKSEKVSLDRLRETV
jgi:hypothetical protein